MGIMVYSLFLLMQDLDHQAVGMLQVWDVGGFRVLNFGASEIRVRDFRILTQGLLGFGGPRLELGLWVPSDRFRV